METRRLVALGLLAFGSVSLSAQELPAEHTNTDQKTALSIETTKKKLYQKGVIGKIYNYFANANKEKPLDKFDFSIIGGPFYNNTAGVGIGLCGSGLYHLQPSNLELPKSSISLTGQATHKGMFSLELNGLNYFPNDRFRAEYRLLLETFKNEFWGLGYLNGDNDDNHSYFHRNRVQFNGNFTFRLAKNTYLGPALYYSYYAADKRDAKANALLVDARTGEALAKHTSTQAVGVTFNYDSRDFALGATKGFYFLLQQRVAPAFLGNESTFSTTELNVRAYTPLWKSGVLAGEVHGVLNCGHEMPWTEMPLVGSSNRMRGYYEGRYRDRNLVEGQVELRQNVWKRIGVAAWVACANAFRDLNDCYLDHTLINYGVGARWEFKQGVNIRLDYGLTRNGSGFVFQINEAF